MNSLLVSRLDGGDEPVFVMVVVKLDRWTPDGRDSRDDIIRLSGTGGRPLLGDRL